MFVDELTIIPTGAALGAEVVGLDLLRPLDAAAGERLRAAFTAHSVLLGRDQHLSQTDQLRISRCFGEPIPHPTNTRDRDPEYPAITILSNIKENGRPVGALGNDEVHWHIDQVFLHMPGSVSVLYCLETPERGGDTWWASGYAAYEALDERTQRQLDGLSVPYRHRRPEYNPPEPAIHPLVCEHPVSRRTAM
jgi:taurine dioxygenase